MAPGYGGTYRGSVVDDVDPEGKHRLCVLVPEVYGEQSAWADASLASIESGSLRIPTIGEEVWISFERGDSDFPVWEASAIDAEQEEDRPGYVGKYRGAVVDNLDPESANRLLVLVPEVLGTDPAWASPSPSAGAGGELQAPGVGDEVWIEFEDGDPQHPSWVGLA